MYTYLIIAIKNSLIQHKIRAEEKARKRKRPNAVTRYGHNKRDIRDEERDIETNGERERDLSLPAFNNAS